MRRSRFVLAGGAVLLLSVALVGVAQEQGIPVPQPGGQPKLPPGGLGGGLLPPGLAGGSELLAPKGVEKLALTKEQKADYDKLNEEYKTKYKECLKKGFAILSETDPAKLKEIIEGQLKARKEAIETSQKLRPDYLAKVEKLLTDDQKKIFDEVRRELPVGGGLGLGGGGFGLGGGFGGFPPGFGGPRSGQFLPADLQKQLKLSDDQKKKVDELQKDLESKILNLLTDDQKKAFEDLKKQSGPGIGLPGNPALVPPPPPPPPPKVVDPGELKKVPDPAELKKDPGLKKTTEPEVKKDAK